MLAPIPLALGLIRTWLGLDLGGLELRVLGPGLDKNNGHTVLIGGVLHLHQLALGGEEAVAAGHQHGRAGGVAHLLSGAAVIIGEAEKTSD